MWLGRDNAHLLVDSTRPCGFQLGNVRQTVQWGSKDHMFMNRSHRLIIHLCGVGFN